MTLRLNLTTILSSLIALAALITSAQAQTHTEQALLFGRILDETNAPIANARVSAHVDGGKDVTTTTDSTGAFSIRLAPGRYGLAITADGFVAASEDISIEVNGLHTMDIVLRVAGFTDKVQVTESGSRAVTIASGTKTPTPLRDVPQSVTVVDERLIKDQLMASVADVVRYVPGISAHQGENNRDQVVIRGNSSSADFYVNGVRDDVQYYRDLYNVERIEALKGPNGMMFGRGGGGGVINRVTKAAGFTRAGNVALQAGSYANRRFTVDANQPLTSVAALRLNGLFEDSASFRQDVSLERYGFAPSLTLAVSPRTMIVLDYERFHDARTADRGVSSYLGRPVDVAASTYFGNPSDSHVRADTNTFSASIERYQGGFTIRNRTVIGDYDRGYQNYVPGAVSDDRSRVALTAYNNATTRLNSFNQTDVTRPFATGRVRHTLLTGIEIGHQLTDNLRNTGFFDNAVTSISVPLANPLTSVPVTFRPSATDANNHLRVNLAAAYAQDQAELSRFVQVIGGVRLDRFDLEYHNNRTDETLRRVDQLVSPRAGVVFKPVTPVSVYGSYAMSYLPSSGDQFSSLTTITQQVKPERFTNYEVGAKWDASANLSLTTALYRLDRTNTRSTDPADPTRIIQTGSQRTDGYELGVNGNVTTRWRIAGGYAHQNARVTSATTAARAGAQVGQVPHHTVSLWNQVQMFKGLGAAIGVVYRADMFAAIDDTVVLPGYTRGDAALFVTLTDRTRLQVNVENVLNRKYFVNADSNTNISPGSPRTLKVALVAGF